MTNGHPGAGGPFEGDDMTARAGPPGRGDVWAPRQPGRPQPPPPNGQRWGPEQARGRLDPGGNGTGQQGRAPGRFGQPPAGQPGQPAAGPASGPFGQAAAGPFRQPGGRPGGYPPAGTGPIPLVEPGPQAPGFGLGTRGFGPERPGQSPWGGPHGSPNAGGVPVQDRYPPVGGYQAGHAAPAAQRGWQDPPDPWGRPAARAWGDSPAGMGGGTGQDPHDALFATQPGSTRAQRQRIAATGGARVKRVWPQRLAVVLLIAAAMVVCWYWVFPWLENILPSEF